MFIRTTNYLVAAHLNLDVLEMFRIKVRSIYREMVVRRLVNKGLVLK